MLLILIRKDHNLNSLKSKVLSLIQRSRVPLVTVGGGPSALGRDRVEL